MRFTKRDAIEAAWIITRTAIGVAGVLLWYVYVLK
jgi:hypothetical protein